MITDYDVDDVGSSSIDGIGGWAPQQLIVVMKCTNNAATAFSSSRWSKPTLECSVWIEPLSYVVILLTTMYMNRHSK